jgi:ribosomal protein S18 acetylase RimI-like enzyme
MSRIGLGPEDWRILRDLRLSALRESPDCFLSAYDRERHFGRQQWLAEFSRGDWHIALSDGQPAGLIGVTREQGDPVSQCYLEYLWVVPQARGTGFALSFLLDVLGQLRATGVRTVLLWVMDGNLPAARLYQKAGFESVGQPVPLAARPGRSEQLFRQELAGPRPGAGLGDDHRPLNPSRPPGVNDAAGAAAGRPATG